MYSKTPDLPALPRLDLLQTPIYRGYKMFFLVSPKLCSNSGFNCSHKFPNYLGILFKFGKHVRFTIETREHMKSFVSKTH